MDISGPGCNPVAAEAQTPPPSKPAPATPTAASEEEQDNSTNSQRRNPRRSDLKRFYTIGEFPFPGKIKCAFYESRVCSFICGLFLLLNGGWLLSLQMLTVNKKLSYLNADVKLLQRIYLLYLPEFFLPPFFFFSP